MKSITLVAPKSVSYTASDIPALTTPLSGILTLATILHKKGYSVKFFDESFKIPNYEDIDSDFVLITSMSATANRAYELADFFRKKGLTVFMGGLHVSFRPKEALEHCDKVVVGEGENVLFDLINNCHKQKIIRDPRVVDLNSVPLPDYSLVEGLINPKVVSVCTSRGCPFNCKFCSLKNLFGREFRFFSTNRVIDYLQGFNNLKSLCLDEPNFTINKERAIEILIRMKKNGIHPKHVWPSVSIDVAESDKLLKLFSDVSQFHLLIGLESINQKTLDVYNKKQTPEIIKNSLKKIKDFGIKIHGSFIFGSDYDDKSVFQKTVDFCHETDIDFPSFGVLTPYVGTDVREELEEQNRIFTNNWDYYDGVHVVFYPKKMTPYELQEGIISAYENFYSKSKILHHLKSREFFYGFETLYVKFLFKKIIRKNKDYLDYLYNISF